MCGGKVEDEETNNDKSNSKFGSPSKYDPSFKGPLKNRSCTDIICCLLFLIFLAGMAACSVFGYIYGDPNKLIYPTDTGGNICGTGAMAGKPNLLFFDFLKCAQMGAAVVSGGCPTPQVCVANCTTDYYVYLETQAKVGLGNLAAISELTCKNGVNLDTMGKTNIEVVTFINQLISDDDCAAYTVPTTSVVGRCVPAIFTDAVDLAQQLTTTGNTSLQNKDGTGITGTILEESSKYMALFMSAAEYGERIFKDVLASWIVILIFLGLTMVLSFIWIVLMRWIAGIMVWISIFLVTGALGFSVYYCFMKYIEVSNNSSYNNLPVVFTTNLSYYTNLKETWLALGIISAVVLLIVLLLVLFLCTRIRIAIQLIKEGSRAIGNMIFTLFWPIFPFILQVAVIAYWGVSAFYIASMGSPEYQDMGTNKSTDGGITYYLERIPCTTNTSNLAGDLCEFVKYGGDQYTIFMQFYMLFMFFWLLNFVIALGEMTLAGAFASYYWAWEKPRDIPAFPLLGSFWRCIRYHFGTLAFGSLIIAIIQIIRVMLEYVDHKLKGSENAVAKFFLKCLKCCFWCLEKFMRFLNRNAYILTAVYGKNFCTSAKNAFFLIMRNIVRTVVLDKIADFVLFLSKLFITAGAFCGAFFWVQGNIPFFTDYIPSLNYYLTPVIIVTIGAYMITCCFFSVYNMAVDTLFLCFLEDIERHDGTPEKPYYMSKDLMSILGKKNK